jgi:hypothetical protein
VGSSTFEKRQKERNRQDKQRAKAAKKADRANNPDGKPVVNPGEDPDLAGIVAGPQPKPEEDEDT